VTCPEPTQRTPSTLPQFIYLKRVLFRDLIEKFDHFPPIVNIELCLTYGVKPRGLDLARQFGDILLADRHATRDTPSAGVKWRPWPLTDPIAQNQRQWRHAKTIAARESGY